MSKRHYRNFHRQEADFRIRARVHERELDAIGKLLNIGVGGASCEVDAPVRIGEIVELSIESRTPFEVAGEVMWIGWGEGGVARMGLRFPPSIPDELEALIELLSQPELKAQ
ncbi:MAG: PilZ domain-containing protein [Polyangiaceae bacterium]|nr:PilZ domain-containing protein [Polyangiaceae bacterium]